MDATNLYIDIEELLRKCNVETTPKDKDDLDFLDELEDFEMEDVFEELDGEEQQEKTQAPKVEQSVPETTINIFKYETYKTLLNRLLDEFPSDDNENRLLNKGNDSFVIDLIMNTFLHDNIIKTK